MDEQTYQTLTWPAKAALVALSTLVVLYLSELFSIVVRRRLSRKKLPPGPTPWPLLGNLPLFFFSEPCKTFVRLAQIYGPVMAFKVGTKPAVIVSSSALAREVLKTHDKNFRLRPVPTMVANFTPSGADSYGDNAAGERWRRDRKLFNEEFMGVKRLEFAKTAAENELSSALRAVTESTEMQSSSGGTEASPEVLLGVFNRITGNVLSQMIFGKRLFGDFRSPISQNCSNNKYAAALREGLDVLTTFDVRDVLQFPKWLDLQGNCKRLAEALKVLDRTIMPLLTSKREELQVNGKVGNDNFLDSLFSMEVSGKSIPDYVKRELCMGLSFGTFSVGLIMEWALVELLKSPSQIRRCKAQLDAVVGKERLVSHSDLPQLPFIRAIIMETLRLHPTPFSIGPCVNVSECELGGYHMPAGSLVFVNVSAINRDPATWADPDTFNPGRHLQSQDGDAVVNVEDFSQIIFGGGRRSCPGRKVAWSIAQMTLASFLHAFDFELPRGVRPQDIDVTTKKTAELTKVKRLQLVPRLRIPRHVIFSER